MKNFMYCTHESCQFIGCVDSKNKNCPFCRNDSLKFVSFAYENVSNFSEAIHFYIANIHQEIPEIKDKQKEFILDSLISLYEKAPKSEDSQKITEQFFIWNKGCDTSEILKFIDKLYPNPVLI